MSLIQDALKRQQEELEGGLAQTGAAPSVPDAMPILPSQPVTLGLALRAGAGPADRSLPAPVNPSATLEPARNATHGVAGGVALRADLEKPGKSWKLIAGIIVLCILIVWGGGLLVVLIMKQSAERTLLGSFMPDLIYKHATLGKSSATPATLAHSGGAQVQAPSPAAHPPAAAISKPMVAPAPASVSEPWLSPAAAAAPAFADEGEDLAEEAALSAVDKHELSATVPSPMPVVWPRLKLSAIFSNLGSGRAGARLNNRLILLGDRIDGVILLEIRQDSVVLKCGKETRSLKMGMTLN